MSDRDAKWADFDYSRLTGQKLLPKYAGGFGSLDQICVKTSS